MQEHPPLVSVIVPTLDRPHLLERAIKSVLAQSFQGFDVWVIDSSPTGSAAPVVEGFADPRLHHVQSPARGVNAARNVGIRMSRGNYVALLDDDDEWLPKKLEVQVALLQRSDQSVGAAFSSYRYVNPAKKFDKVVHISEQKSVLYPRSTGTASATVIRREVFDEVGLFDEAMPGVDDWDMWINISEKYRFAYAPEVLMNYYVTPDNLTSDRSRQVRGNRLLLLKYPRLLGSRRFMAHYYGIVGQLLCSQGLMARGRRYLLSSHLSNRGLYSLLLLVLTVLGTGAYNRLFAMIGDTPVSLRLERLVERTG